MRKITSLIIPLLIALARVAPAQVSVSVVFEQDQFLPGEAILAAVKIANYQDLNVHELLNADWLVMEKAAADNLKEFLA